MVMINNQKNTAMNNKMATAVERNEDRVLQKRINVGHYTGKVVTSGAKEGIEHQPSPEVNNKSL